MDHTAAAKDFRQFIKELNDEGELVTITKEVDPDLELGAIVRRVYETGERAPLFVNPKGRKDDGLFRMLGAPFGTSKRPGLQLCRIAKALGLPSSATAKQIVERINEAKEKPPIPCNQLKTSPIKEHILRGDEIDLTQLPAPMLHEDDGGKYLETLGMHVVQSPDGKWTNWSITRGMIIGKREMTGPVILRQDIGAIWSMWKEKGEDMPWALAFGVPPAAIMVSGMPLPKWTNESEYIGALTGAPVDVVKCESNNLWVPANAEIVFEGVVSISETSPEGPMVEYNGMIFPGEKHPWPVFKVNTITYRKDPILPVCVAGRAPDETHTIWNTMQAGEVLNICQKAGFPINTVWCPFESHCMWFVAQVDCAKLIQMKTTMEEFCRKLGHTVFQSRPGYYIPKLFVVGDYIDPSNLDDVIWAEATRCEPGRHEFLFFEYPNFPLIPYATHGVSTSEQSGKVVKCCMLPDEFTGKGRPWKDGSFNGEYPEKIKQKVRENWVSYGFDAL